MKNPTTPKVLNRGFVPISYRTNHGIRYGWLVEGGRGGTCRIQLPGEERCRNLNRKETAYVVEL